MSHIPFLVTVTLTSDLVLRFFVFGAYLLYSLREVIPNLVCVYASWDGGVSHIIFWRL